jgi:2,5-furandicarboxylate decarboxylase 1
VKGKDKIGIFLATPPLSNFLAKAENIGKPLEIAIVSGVDPLTFCASILYAPEGVDKFDIAGGFAKSPIDLIKCRSVDLEVPANAEFILEGSITPGVREKEGPFGESSGYYIAYNNPAGKITTITHRAKPIYHALVPFTAEDANLWGIMTEPYVTEKIKAALPDVRIESMKSLLVGEFRIVQIDKKDETDASKVIDYLLSDPFTRIVVVTDIDVDIADLKEVAWAITTRVQADRGVIIKSDLLGCVIDPSVKRLEKAEFELLAGRTSKIGINATKPLDQLGRFERIDVPAKVRQKIAKLLEVLR